MISHERSTYQLIEKVKLAMLTMQRYQWEQGVAAQALLELGETTLAILMAREAALRQAEDGRLAVMGGNASVTDPASNGEACSMRRRSRVTRPCAKRPTVC